MADHKKASHHHKKAGEAFARGDVKEAAKHMGHSLAALRAGASMAEPDDDDMGGPPDTDEDDMPMAAPKVSLRDRLKGIKK